MPLKTNTSWGPIAQKFEGRAVLKNAVMHAEWCVNAEGPTLKFLGYGVTLPSHSGS